MCVQYVCVFIMCVCVCIMSGANQYSDDDIAFYGVGVLGSSVSARDS